MLSAVHFPRHAARCAALPAPAPTRHSQGTGLADVFNKLRGILSLVPVCKKPSPADLVRAAQPALQLCQPPRPLPQAAACVTTARSHRPAPALCLSSRPLLARSCSLR